MSGIQSLMQGAAPQGPQQSTPQGPQPRQGMSMAPQNNPSMSAAMDLATDELDALDLDPRTKAMLKTQEAYDLMQSAQRELAMAQQQPMPPTIEGQRTQQTMQGIGALMQQLSPGIQQQGQQMAMAQRRSPMQGQRPPMQGQRPPMPQQGMAGMPARNMQGMARGGVVGYAGPDGSQVRPTPTLGAVPPSAVGDEQIKQFASYYQTLQAGLAAATTPEDKAQSQQQIQALIRDMGNAHGKVMQYIDSTKGFTTPSSQMARGGIVGFDGRDGSQVQGLTPAMQREVEKIELETQDAGAVSLDQRELMAASLARVAEQRARAAERDVRSPDNELFNIKTGLLNKGYSQKEIERIISAGPQFETTNPQTGPFPPSLIGGNRTGIISDGGGRGDTFAPAVGVDTSGAGSPQSNIDTTLSSIAALTVPETNIKDLARSPLRDPIENAALKNIKLDASALSNTARKAEQGLASQAYAMSPEMKAAYARKQQESDAEYAAQLDPKKLKDQRVNALLTGLAAPGGIARGGIEALKGVTAVGDTAAELRRKQSEERFGSAKEREGINREGKIKGYEAGSRMAQSVYERTSATVNQASQSLSQLATSDETRGQAAAVQEYTRQMDGLKLQLNVFLQKEKIDQDDRQNIARIVSAIRRQQDQKDDVITDIQAQMLLMDDAAKTAAMVLIKAATDQKEALQTQIDTALTSIGVATGVTPSGGGGERAALPAGFVPD